MDHVDGSLIVDIHDLTGTHIFEQIPQNIVCSWVTEC